MLCLLCRPLELSLLAFGQLLKVPSLRRWGMIVRHHLSYYATCSHLDQECPSQPSTYYTALPTTSIS